MGKYGKQEIYSLLKEKGVPHKIVEHEAVFTMEAMEQAGINKYGCICKNLFLRDAKGKQHFLVSVPDEQRVDLKALGEQLGTSKLSFASAERLEKYLGLAQGSVSPFGILNDESRSVIFVAAHALEAENVIGIHPNENTATVFLSFADVKNIIEEHGNKVVMI